MKQTTQQLHQMELRLTRSLEENEKLRGTIKSNKSEEKDLRNEIKKLKDSEKNTINKLQRQKSEVLQSFKKQILLIDNLKKQKAILAVSKQVQLTQDDLSEILDSNVVGSSNGS